MLDSRKKKVRFRRKKNVDLRRVSEIKCESQSCLTTSNDVPNVKMHLRDALGILM